MFVHRRIKKKVANHRFTTLISGERGSRTYEIIEFHKISIRCKLSVYKIIKFIETHRVHFDISAPSKRIKREDLTLESMVYRITLGSDARKMSLWKH